MRVFLRLHACVLTYIIHTQPLNQYVDCLLNVTIELYGIKNYEKINKLMCKFVNIYLQACLQAQSGYSGSSSR